MKACKPAAGWCGRGSVGGHAYQRGGGPCWCTGGCPSLAAQPAGHPCTPELVGDQHAAAVRRWACLEHLSRQPARQPHLLLLLRPVVHMSGLGSSMHAMATSPRLLPPRAPVPHKHSTHQVSTQQAPLLVSMSHTPPCIRTTKHPQRAHQVCDHHAPALGQPRLEHEPPDVHEGRAELPQQEAGACGRGRGGERAGEWEGPGGN